MHMQASVASKTGAWGKRRSLPAVHGGSPGGGLGGLSSSPAGGGAPSPSPDGMMRGEGKPQASGWTPAGWFPLAASLVWSQPPCCLQPAGLCEVREGQGMQGPPVPNPKGRVLSANVPPWDPKGGELYLATMKPWETAVEVGMLS